MLRPAHEPEDPAGRDYRRARTRYYLAEGFDAEAAALAALADVLEWQHRRDQPRNSPTPENPHG